MTGIILDGGGGGNSLSPLTNGAKAMDILSPKRAYDDEGNLLVGTIQTKQAETFNTAETDRVIQGGQYLGGDQTIKAVNASVLEIHPDEALYAASTINAPAGTYFKQVKLKQIVHFSGQAVVKDESILSINKQDLFGSEAFAPYFLFVYALTLQQGKIVSAMLEYPLGTTLNAWYMNNSGVLVHQTLDVDWNANGAIKLTSNSNRFSTTDEYYLFGIGLVRGV